MYMRKKSQKKWNTWRKKKERIKEASPNKCIELILNYLFYVREGMTFFVCLHWCSHLYLYYFVRIFISYP